MEFYNLKTKKIKMFPEHNDQYKRIIIEFNSIREFNKFMNNIGDLLDFKGCNFIISNNKKYRTIILNNLSVNSYIKIYEYFNKYRT